MVGKLNIFEMEAYIVESIGKMANLMVTMNYMMEEQEKFYTNRGLKITKDMVLKFILKKMEKKQHGFGKMILIPVLANIMQRVKQF